VRPHRPPKNRGSPSHWTLEFFFIKPIYSRHKYAKNGATELSTSLVYIVKLISQLLIEYSICFKIVFSLALNFYVYIDDDKSTKEANNFYFYIESIINYTYDGCFGREKLFKIKFFYELFLVNNNSRDVKWLGDSIYRKKVVG
jgi:hypothetical protein